MATPTTKEIIKARLKFVHELTTMKFVQDHLYEFVWISGESTEVYPISLNYNSVNLQWKTNRDCKRWIDNIVKKHSDILKYGYFSKTDGSCPSEICFQFHKDYAFPLWVDYPKGIQVDPKAQDYDAIIKNLYDQNILKKEYT